MSLAKPLPFNSARTNKGPSGCLPAAAAQNRRRQAQGERVRFDMSNQRPPHHQPPPYLSPSPPVPAPAEAVPQPDPDALDPVRYGDWERKGIAVDF